jgi:hypothetical protein
MEKFLELVEGAVEVGPVSKKRNIVVCGTLRAVRRAAVWGCVHAGSRQYAALRSTRTPAQYAQCRSGTPTAGGHGPSAIRFEGDDLFQSAPQHGGLVPAEKPRPLLLDVREDPGGCALRGAALVGESDDLRAAVGFVGDPLEIAVIF